MTEPFSAVSRLLHHRTQGLRKGDPIALPIIASSTFHQPGDPDGSHYYGRSGNPTIEAAETAIGILEGADVVLFPSGMAAIAAIFFTQLAPGDTVLVHADGYFNARALLEAQFAPRGITVRACPTGEMTTADLESCRLVLAETPSNPGLAVCDIAALSRRARAAGALLAVDNTTATPICQQPLDFGADFVVMADTKAMAGHSDVLAGHVASRNPGLIAQIRAYRKVSGAIVSPFDAFLLHRGLETLDLRVARANASALALSELLSKRPEIAGLRYPGLPGDPFHALAARQMTGFGPIVCFTLPSRSLAEAFIDNHPLLAAATSFGGVHSSAECRIRWGDAVAEGFVRFACGIEPTADLLRATTETLDQLRA